MRVLLKKALLFTAFFLIPGFCHAQGLERGNLIGVHVVTVNLKPSATMEEFTKFYVGHVLPEYEKNWPG